MTFGQEAEQYTQKVRLKKTQTTMMKNFKMLMASGYVCFSFSLPSFAAESDLELSLEEQPTFGLFQEKGVKFLLPGVGAGPRRPGYPITPAWEVDSLKAESTSVSIMRNDAKSNPLALSKVHFSRDDFQSPGKYYPPKPAVGNTTPIVQISLSADQLALDDASALLVSLVPVCSLDSSRILAWFEARLWDAAPRLKLEGKFPKGSALIYLSKAGGKESEPVFSVSVRIKWAQPAKAEQGGAGQPAAAVEPTPDETQKPKTVVLPRRQ